MLELTTWDTWDIESIDWGQLFFDRSRLEEFDNLDKWDSGMQKHISFRLQCAGQRLFSLELQWSALGIFGQGSKTIQSQPKTDLLIIFYQARNVLQVSKPNVLELSIKILN